MKNNEENFKDEISKFNNRPHENLATFVVKEKNINQKEPNFTKLNTKSLEREGEEIFEGYNDFVDNWDFEKASNSETEEDKDRNANANDHVVVIVIGNDYNNYINDIMSRCFNSLVRVLNFSF